jgi:transglutaminase-like putative cysteine protease
MIQAILRRLFHFREMILLLSLAALACLPVALSKIVRDAGLSLLLPLTLIGVLLAWALAVQGVRNYSSACILLILGPLALYVRIGQIGSSLFEFIKQSVNLILALINWQVHKTPFDLADFFASRADLLQRTVAMGGRLSLWFAGFSHGIVVEDPVIRTLIWSMALWLIAVWAGWQIYRHQKFMLGMLPCTLLLFFVLDYTGQQKTVLWLYLVLLLFLFGLTNYHNLLNHWKASNTDYAESTSMDTLVLVGAITTGLVVVSFFVATVSIKDILNDFREKRAGSNESQASALGLETAADNFRVTGFQGGLPRSYLLTAGPELSTQLAITISTGDLPPMPAVANPTVPHYYWRALTYSIYTGSGWDNPSVLAEDIPADQAVLIDKPDPNHRVIHANVTFPDDSGGRLFWPGTLVRANVPFKAAWTHKAADGKFIDADLLAALAPVKSYTAESIVLNVTAQDLRAAPSVYPEWVDKEFLKVPGSVPERVLALARDLTASEPTPYDRALAIQNYLRKFPYTLDVPAPPSGRDVADYFLFDLKKGYCDYYATSMVVLARAAGLPARLVVGYANGFYNIERAQYVVTENYAHSWVEIYFADIGWVEFEPTASEPAILYRDSDNLATPVEIAAPVRRPFGEKIASFLQSRFQNAWLPAIVMAICGLLWIGSDSLRLNRIEPSQAIQLLYKRLRRLARPLTGAASKNETAHSYSLAVNERLSSIKTGSRLQNLIFASRGEIDRLTELFTHSLFAPLPASRAEANEAVKTWSRLRWRLILANILRIKNK